MLMSEAFYQIFIAFFSYINNIMNVVIAERKRPNHRPAPAKTAQWHKQQRFFLYDESLEIFFYFDQELSLP